MVEESQRAVWSFTPFEHVGPLRFGMTHDRAAAAVDGVLKTIGWRGRRHDAECREPQRLLGTEEIRQPGDDRFQRDVGVGQFGAGVRVVVEPGEFDFDAHLHAWASVEPPSWTSSGSNRRRRSDRSGSKTKRSACRRLLLPIWFSPTITAGVGNGSISNDAKLRKFST
ncbi:hypothetical protein OG928_46855 (plasmid) [Embleya sp. NBC_00896]|nr:hypothetical protein OG928_46855 [Embleya sp. NBC_00896]